MVNSFWPGCLLLALGAISAAAQPPADSQTKGKALADQREDAVLEQERLARQFREFESSLLRLAQRLERSSKPEDRERAALLKRAIKKAGDQAIDAKFDTLIGLLRGS